MNSAQNPPDEAVTPRVIHHDVNAVNIVEELAVPEVDLQLSADESEQAYSDWVCFSKAFEFAADYFLYSDEVLKAWLLLISAILCVIALVALMNVFASWQAAFVAALIAKDIILFIALIPQFFYIVLSLISLSIVRDYCLETLAISWTKRLREIFSTMYADKKDENGDNNYLDCTRFAKQISNPGQRIQEEISVFVQQTLALSLGLLNSVLTLVTSIGFLWVTGGAFSCVIFGLGITIPGYLVWVAIITAIVASVLTRYIGSSLSELDQQQQSLEADFRKQLDFIGDAAEGIAAEHAEVYYVESLMKSLNAICNNAIEKLQVNSCLNAFRSFYGFLSSQIAFFAAAPLYFSNMIELGDLFQIDIYFNQTKDSLSWFVDNYDVLAKYTASIGRIITLENALKKGGLKSTEKAILVKDNNDSDELMIKNLNTVQPIGSKILMCNLNLTFKRGEHTLIKGPSGIGKSTLFKVILGHWEHGSGDVLIPRDCKILYLPQNPILPPNTTLRSILAYPYDIKHYKPERYIQVLHDIGGDMDQYIEKLDETGENWSQRFSRGEQQRIAFARALLQEPDWLFLDEATASIDEEGELDMYHLIKTQLPNTTIMSIAHRSTVAQFHSRTITFNKARQVADDLSKPIDQQSVVRTGMFGRTSSSASNEGFMCEPPRLSVMR